MAILQSNPNILWRGTKAQADGTSGKAGVLGYLTDTQEAIVFVSETPGDYKTIVDNYLDGLASDLSGAEKEAIKEKLGVGQSYKSYTNEDCDDIYTGETVDGHVVISGEESLLTISDAGASQTHPVKPNWNSSTVWGDGKYIVKYVGTPDDGIQTRINLSNGSVAKRSRVSGAWMSLTYGGISSIGWFVDDYIIARGLTTTNATYVGFDVRSDGIIRQFGNTSFGTVAGSATSVLDIGLAISLTNKHYADTQDADRGESINDPSNFITAVGLREGISTSTIRIQVRNTVATSKASNVFWEVTGTA